MARVAIFETYAPVHFDGEEDFFGGVTALVRDHLDDKSSSGVVTRTSDKLIAGVSNKAQIFRQGRYYFGRLIVPNVTHNSRKLDQIRDRLLEPDAVYRKYASALMELTIDKITTVEIQSTTGPNTLIVAGNSRQLDPEIRVIDDPLATYTDEVVGATNAMVRRRQSMEGARFNTLNGCVPIASLGNVVTTGVDTNLLVKNIGELVEDQPLETFVEIPEDGLVTILKS